MFIATELPHRHNKVRSSNHVKFCNLFSFFFKLVDRLHKYGLCLDKTIKYAIQEEVGKHFFDSAIKLVQEGKTFAFVLDNIDRDVRVHGMRFESQNKSVHGV